MGKSTVDGLTKRILVISNNPFSTKRNNGKTLKSFFESYPSNNIAQLYFNPEKPDVVLFNNYFRVSDNDVLNKILGLSKKCGEQVFPVIDEKVNRDRGLFSKISRNHFTRIMRDLMWKTNVWKTSELQKWLDDFKPDIIFFLAGDSGFSYDICKYVVNRFNSKLAMYITDDYILPRHGISLFLPIKRHFLKKKLHETIHQCDILFTISTEMGYLYERIFSKKSFQLVNISESLYSLDANRNLENEIISLVYVGGLHYNRDKTLSLLAQAIKKFNDASITKKAFLKIFSTQAISEKKTKELSIEGASEFCGKLDSEGVKRILNQCDIPVHVESFQRKNISSTLLSISTKIPEYLSLGKCILAIGPAEISSMKYLSDCAFCITNDELITERLKFLFQEKSTYVLYSSLGYKKYLKYHSKEKVTEEFQKHINEMYL